MRRIHFIFVAAAISLTPGSVFAEATSEDAAFNAIVADIAESVEPLPADVAEAGITEPRGLEISIGQAPESHFAQGVILGPEGMDSQGRIGRLHTVASGDTLWDLADAYLGTPWVWPSVWIDNDDIENPHLILPGNKIWITANEMRVVTEAEAESFLEAVPVEADVADLETPAAMDAAEEAYDFDAFVEVEDVSPVAALDDATALDESSTLEAFPIAIAGQEAQIMAFGQQITISRRHAMGFVTADELAGASSIVDSSVERTYLAEGDPVVLGMGEGDVEVGDQFSIFRVIEEVRDIETNRILGHHVEILGWAEVRKLTGDTSLAEIRMSYAELRRGVRVMRRPDLSRHVTSRSTPDAIEGKIVFLPDERALMGDGGYVYLNRGEFHGLEVGSELEVYESGRILNDRARRVDVQTPDHLVAKMIVVSVTAESSVAFVLTSNRELEVGDDVRPVVSRMAQR